MSESYSYFKSLLLDASSANYIMWNRFGPSGAETAATKQIQARFHGFAANDQNYQTIPALDKAALSARSVRNNQTVRYRGLVQVTSLH